MKVDEQAKEESATGVRKVRPLCGIGGCSCEAAAFVVLLLRPKNWAGPPVEAALPVPLCPDHAASDDPEDYIDHNGWAKLQALMVARRLRRMHRSMTKLRFIEIGSPEAAPHERAWAEQRARHNAAHAEKSKADEERSDD